MKLLVLHKLEKLTYRKEKIMINKRLNEIDLMRVIGFLMVVDQHILGAYAQRPETGFWNAMVLHFLYLLGRPAVPIFIAITGFTLFHVYYTKIDVLKFYRKRFATIVMPYLFWSIASILIFKKYDMLEDLLPILMTGTASYHLWYMCMSIRLYMWFPAIRILINWIAKKSSKIKTIAFILFCIIYWIVFKEKAYFVNILANHLFAVPSILEKRFIEYSPIFWSIYFMFGVLVFFRYEKFKIFVLKHSRMIAITYLPIVLYMYYTHVCSILPGKLPIIYYNHVLYVIYMLQTSVLVYIVSLKVSKGENRLSNYIFKLGELSFGAYLVHVIVLQSIAPIIRSLLPAASYLEWGIVIFIATSILSFAICFVISYIPFSRYIIGTKARRNVGL
jgi:probable poly-beta-1,6-N-acetyl-D-glucosamine export protein